jgi:hypothetical protein
MLQDRRQYQRVIPDQLLLVRCGESQCRLLFDLSEEGLAIDDLGSESSAAQVIPLVFDLPGGHGHIQANGEIAWTNDSEKRTGLRFVDLADNSRQQLKQWVSASVFDTTELALADEEPAQPPVLLPYQTDSVDFLAPQPMPNERLSRHGASHHLTWLVLGVLSLFSGVAFVRHYLGNTGSSWRTKEIMAAGKVPEILPAGPIASVKLSPATTPPLPPALPLDVPGFRASSSCDEARRQRGRVSENLAEKEFPRVCIQARSQSFLPCSHRSL